MQEKLTVILFKNHLTSRTFEVSLRKLERIGISFVVVIFLALFSSLFFVRAGVKMLNTRDAGAEKKAIELEKQLADMKTQYEALQDHLSRSSAPGTNLSQSSIRSVLFTSVPPASVRSPIPPRDSLPFRLEPLKARWQGNFLYINTAIEYNRGDEGTQQGNFIIMAQGPQNLYAHPEGAFSEAGSETLIDPESGEYFSVARYREIRARFGPVERRDQIQSISIYLFDRNKNLIYLDRIRLKDAVEGGSTAAGPGSGASSGSSSGAGVSGGASAPVPLPIPKKAAPVPPASSSSAPESSSSSSALPEIDKNESTSSSSSEPQATGSSGN